MTQYDLEQERPLTVILLLNRLLAISSSPYRYLNRVHAVARALATTPEEVEDIWIAYRAELPAALRRELAVRTTALYKMHVAECEALYESLKDDPACRQVRSPNGQGQRAKKKPEVRKSTEPAPGLVAGSIVRTPSDAAARMIGLISREEELYLEIGRVEEEIKQLSEFVIRSGWPSSVKRYILSSTKADDSLKD